MFFLVPAVSVHFDVRSESEPFYLLEVYRDSRFILIGIVYCQVDYSLDLELFWFSIHINQTGYFFFHLNHHIFSKRIMSNGSFNFFFLNNFASSRFSQEIVFRRLIKRLGLFLGLSKLHCLSWNFSLRNYCGRFSCMHHAQRSHSLVFLRLSERIIVCFCGSSFLCYRADRGRVLKVRVKFLFRYFSLVLSCDIFGFCLSS